MCKWGTKTLVKVTVPARLSHTGKERIKMAGIDSCIAPIVKMFNDNGMLTDASCCGHGKMFGNIVLADGKEIMISPDWETTRKAEKILIKNGVLEPIN